MLRFIPIQQLKKTNNITVSSGFDDWHNNDDDSLLEPLAASDNNLQNTLTHLQSSQAERTFKLEQLDLMPTHQSCEIILQDGKKVILQDKDVLKLPYITLQVIVIPSTNQAIPAHSSITAPNSLPATAHQDIWGNNLLTNELRKKIIDPFQDAVPVVSMGHTTQRNSYYSCVNNNVSTSIVSHTAIPAINNLNKNIAAGDILNSLSIDAKMNYVPTPTILQTTQAHRQPPLAVQANQMSPTDGNVLRDLGINEQATVLPTAILDGKQRTFMEQSPLDLINDCWDEMGAAEQAMPTNFAGAPNFSRGTPGIKQNLKRLARKILD